MNTSNNQIEFNDIKKNITVIIQGPIDERSYESIDAYGSQGFTDILVSTWDNQETSLLKRASYEYRICYSAFPTQSQIHNINNEGSRFYQAVTTLNGCTNSDKDFVLKTRSDEVYPNLDRFLSNFLYNKDKIHTTNNGFWKHIPFCFSNHLFLGKKTVIKNACEYIIEHCIGEQFNGLNIFCAEQEFGYFLMYSIDNNFDPYNWLEYFKKYVFITPCSDLPDHLHSGGTSEPHSFKRNKNYPYSRPDNHPIDKLYNSSEEF